MATEEAKPVGVPTPEALAAKLRARRAELVCRHPELTTEWVERVLAAHETDTLKLLMREASNG